jgi:hypothetical protein
VSARHKVILWAGLALIIGMGICPPYHMYQRDIAVDLGYYFIASPPEYGEIDLKRLLIQWAVVCFAAGGLLLSVRKPTG